MRSSRTRGRYCGIMEASKRNKLADMGDFGERIYSGK